MKKVVSVLFFLSLTLLAFGVKAEAEMLSPSEVKTKTERVASATEKTPVTAVYGVTADDYLPSAESSAYSHLRPRVRRARSHPKFDLPDAFFFIGGPIFLLIFLRVLALFISEFEATSKDEKQKAASEMMNLK
ncbi:MAG: hypothetical protein OES84_03720 [Kiritimatiellaceae bacterium]|nr:hypothetical protein [Kiritimatiellaceae bacterium]